MKRLKLAAIFYCIAAVLTYIAGLFTMLCNSNTDVGVLLACIGSGMLCLVGVWMQCYPQDRTKEDFTEK